MCLPYVRVCARAFQTKSEQISTKAQEAAAAMKNTIRRFKEQHPLDLGQDGVGTWSKNGSPPYERSLQKEMQDWFEVATVMWRLLLYSGCKTCFSHSIYGAGPKHTSVPDVVPF